MSSALAADEEEEEDEDEADEEKGGEAPTTGPPTTRSPVLSVFLFAAVLRDGEDGGVSGALAAEGGSESFAFLDPPLATPGGVFSSTSMSCCARARADVPDVPDCCCCT